jgi:manganese/iron transport system ATP-binding protein
MPIPTIQLNAVSVTYPNGHMAIDGISATLPGGRICGLIGMNGSGKSTLFKCMMGFLNPTSGSVLINNGPVKHALKRNQVAYVPQADDIDWDFPILVDDVVLMGRYTRMGPMRIPTAHDRACADQALDRVGMTAYRNRQIGELSGGQKKRVFVARALAQEAPIILLDEPFTGVDNTTESTLTDLFQTLRKSGHLIIVSTHNLGSVPAFCDTVMLINQRLLAYGETATTFTRPNLEMAFGGMLRHHQIEPSTIHRDSDHRSVTVLTDDERPVVFYGDDQNWDLVEQQAKE